jgi:hypothetical protein
MGFRNPQQSIIILNIIRNEVPHFVQTWLNGSGEGVTLSLAMHSLWNGKMDMQ